MSQGDSQGGKRRLSEEKCNREGQEAIGDGSTSRSVKATQLDNVGNNTKRKLSRSEKELEIKLLYRRERERGGRHEEAEIQRNSLIRGKNLAYNKDTCLEKERLLSR